jgi:S1-C subfamily serine protease
MPKLVSTRNPKPIRLMKARPFRRAKFFIESMRHPVYPNSMYRKFLQRFLIQLLGVTVCLATFVKAGETQAPEAAAEIYQEVAPSVFIISVCNDQGEPTSFGTGFLIGENTLATNLHVIEGTHVFLEQGPVRIPVTVDKRDPINDLAIIKVAVHISATPLLLSAKKLIPGENMFVIGNPEGLDKSISAGIVAANREFDGRKLVQITAPISHGSSGGPVLDAAGKVVGITVAMMKNGQNLNFAVPAERLEELLSGKNSGPQDLAAVFQRIDGLKAVHAKQQYSDEPDSEWQNTFREIDALLKSALDQASKDPNLLLKVAEEAIDTDLEIKLFAAQRATEIKPSSRSNLLLGEALRVQAIYAEQSEKGGLLQRAEKALRSALRMATNPTPDLYYDLADVIEDRGLTGGG